MKPLRRVLLGAASLIGGLFLLSSQALAAPGQGGGGGGGGGGGTYSDLNIVLRALNGTPVLKKFTVPPTAENTESTTEYCPQPISYTPIPGVTSTTNPVDAKTVWVVPLQGEWINTPGSPLSNTTLTACAAQTQDAMFVSEVDLERLNMSRTTDTVTARRLATVTKLLESATTIGLESTGRILINTTPTTPIDSPNENQAIYKSLLWTGAIPGLPTTLASPEPHIGIFNAMDLAAVALGATASKTVPLSVDAIEYYNQVIGYPPATLATGNVFTPPLGLNFVTSTNPGTSGQPMTGTQKYVDFTTIGGKGPFTYNRAQTFTGSVTWLTVPHLTWKVTPIVTAVPFHNLTARSATTTLTGVAAFAQMADDVRALCDYIPDNTFIPGFSMDVPGQDTTATQLKAITDPAVDLGKLPANAIETVPFAMTSQLLNPFAGTTIPNARLRITVHAPGPLSDTDVSANAATGQRVPFTASGTELTGWWGPATGFPVTPGYNQSTTFTVAVANGAPTGTYAVTLDLVTVLNATHVLATDTAKIAVLSNQPTVLWGESVPRLMTQSAATAFPLEVYSPVAGTGQLSLTVTGPGLDPTTVLTATDVRIYASNGSTMVKMALAADPTGALVGTWTQDLLAGTTPVTWYVTVATGAPVGQYAFEVSLTGGNTLAPITVTVAASESGGGGKKPPNAGEKGITSSASTTFTESQRGAFTVTTSGSPAPTLTEVGALPTGVTFVDNGDGTATLVGTPVPGSTGTYPFSVYAQYDTTIVVQTFSLRVAATSGSTTPTTPVETHTQGQTQTHTQPPIETQTPVAVGYHLASLDGSGVSFSGDGSVHSTGAMHLNAPVVGTASAPDGKGYWEVASDGGVFSFGGASFFGSMGGHHLNAPIVGMASAPDGKGYWLVASDGGIFSFGDASFFGSTGAMHLNAPVVGMASAPDGKGYWLVASDGGVFSFGDVSFFGSTGAMHLNAPVVGMASAPDGKGYWLVASDGGIFSFGDASFFGSTGAMHLNAPVVGMASAPDGKGYWLVASDGGIFSFGDAVFHGSAGGRPGASRVVGMTLVA